MKKGRHRRYEEARKFKRSHEDDLDDLIETFNEEHEFEKPEHAAWAEEFDGNADDATEADDDRAERASDDRHDA